MFRICLSEGIKNIDKNKVLTYLTVLLFSFLFLLQGYTYAYKIVNDELNGLLNEDSFSEYQVYRFGSKLPSLLVFNSDEALSGDLKKELSDFYNELDVIENLHYNILENTALPILDYKLSNRDSENLNEDGSENVTVYKCSPSFYRTENYRVVLGRNFTDEDSVYVEGSPRPVLLGYQFKDHYKVGDIIELGIAAYSNSPKNDAYYFDSLEVVGILAEDSTYIGESSDRIYDLDRTMIIPAIWIEYDDISHYEKPVEEIALNLSKYYWIHTKLMFNSEHEESVLEQVQEALNSLSTISKYYRPVNSKYVVEKMESRTAAVMEFSATITTVLMTFAFITILISIVNRISRNLKDYSIHVALGATRGNIVGFIISEMSIILLCSIVFGTVATRLVTQYLYLYFDLFKFLGVYIATSLFVLMISAITAVISIKRSYICTLVK